MTRRYTVTRAFHDLNAIDEKKESGRYTKKQHDNKSKAVLKRLKSNG